MQIKYIKHKDCSDYLLNKICSLKKQHWNYPISSQKKWIDDNFNDNDIHLCLSDNGLLLAYLSIQSIQYSTSIGTPKEAFGVGSVCVDRKHVGKEYGFLMMSLATFYIKQRGMNGFLLCKDELVSFYKKCNWLIIRGGVNCNIMSNSHIDGSAFSFNKLF